MKVIYDELYIKDDIKRGIGLGNFDGIHLGHKKLIDTLVSECNKRSIQSMVYTFSNHPEKILTGTELKLLTSLEKKIELLNTLELESLCLKTFDTEFSDMEPEEFVKDLLVGRYNMKLAVTGFNYKFGRQGLGDLDFLKSSGKKYGFEVLIVDPVKMDDHIISSTSIRESIKSGDMEITLKMLGRPYSIRGKVEYGNRIGSEIGFPTANIIPVNDYALPKNGVYYTNTIVDGVKYNSITNLGTKPTVDKGNRLIIETHIFDFCGWLYGKEIDVLFIKRIRDEVKYSSTEKLKEQIIKDINSAKEFFKENS